MFLRFVNMGDFYSFYTLVFIFQVFIIDEQFLYDEKKNWAEKHQPS